MNYPDIKSVTTQVVPTANAAYYLQLTRSTLQQYARRPEAPIRPLRIGRKYFWKVADIKALLGVTE
jgi:hypothetical protein